MQAQYDNDMFIWCRWEPDLIFWLWYCCNLLITAASQVDVYQHVSHLSCKQRRVAKLINHHSYSVYSIKSKGSGAESLADGKCSLPLLGLLLRQRWRKYLDYYWLL